MEVLASTSAILQRVRECLGDSCLSSMLRAAHERGELSLENVILAAHSGDKLAFQILDEAGTYVGIVLAMALNLLGLDLVVLGGPVAQGDGIVLEAVRRQVRLRALQYISSRTRITCDDQGELAGARGAGLLALDALFGSDEHLLKLIRPSLARNRVRARVRAITLSRWKPTTALLLSLGPGLPPLGFYPRPLPDKGPHRQHG